MKNAVMARLLDLPPEILHLILDELPRRTRYHTALTCKYLGLLAVPGLYSVCYFKYCDQRGTYVLCGPVEKTTVDCLTYAKYCKDVKHLRIDHYYYFCDNIFDPYPRLGGELYRPASKKMNSPASQYASSIPNQLSLLLPTFTGLRTIELMDAGWVAFDPMRQIRTIQIALSLCQSLNELSFEINYDSQDEIPDWSDSQIGRELNPNQNYPRLTSLTIQLNDGGYNGDLEPTETFLNLVCGILHRSSRTVKRFRFELKIGMYDDDLEFLPWYCPPRGPEEPWLDLDLPVVETVYLDLSEETLFEHIFFKYFHIDTTKVTGMTLVRPSRYLKWAHVQEDEVPDSVKFLTKFPSLKGLKLWYPKWADWIDGAFEAKQALTALRELRVLLESDDFIPEGQKSSLFTEIIEKHGSQYNPQIIKVPAPTSLPFENVMLIFDI